jgi:hypothetical protein
MKTDFCTRPFFRSHMREPRGFGSWAFAPTAEAPMEQVVFSPSMTFTAAKKWVRETHPTVRRWFVQP